MVSCKIIDGKQCAEELRAGISVKVAALEQKHNMVPGLSVILVGDDPASQVYVRNKEKAAQKAGINGQLIRLPATTTQDEVVRTVQKLNGDKTVHGILVQLPLPKHIDSAAVVQAIDPAKDVDGLHIENMGRLMAGLPGMVPCTPLGCLILLQKFAGGIAGKNAVVIGRSNLVGKPMAHLLLKENATVTIAHSRTGDLPDVVRGADIVVAAVGQPELVKADWIKPGAVVIDVGINRVGDRLVGDVAFDEAVKVAGALTPVPGGVGPMTIACLLANTVEAFERSIAPARR